MLRAVGLEEDDFARPQVGLVSAGNEVTPCNLTGPMLAAEAKRGVRAKGGVGLTFATIAVSDGISMGHEGMRASLVSREVIADSVELVMHAERFDALVAIAGCDKSLPGMLMAAARLNLPAVFLYGGSSLPGRLGDRDISLVDVFEGIGALSEGRIGESDLLDLERNACPGAGSCAGMFTANTMASVGEALGMSLPGSASVPAVDPRLVAYAAASGEAVMALLERGLRPRAILTREAFENAVTTVMALGGSTNAVLHLMAIAREAGVELELEDFDRISRRTPHLGDLKPFGRFHMVDLDRVGGVPCGTPSPARRRFAPRRRYDRDRPHHGREPGGGRSAKRPIGDPLRRRPARRPGGDRSASRLALPGGGRGQGGWNRVGALRRDPHAYSTASRAPWTPSSITTSTPARWW